MARKSSVESWMRICKRVKAKKPARDALKAKVYDRTLPPEERFAAQMKLAQMPRTSSATRIRNRCVITGRSRGVYRKFGISRIMMRDMVAGGLLPGVRKASW